MAKKSDLIPQLIADTKTRQSYPTGPKEGLTLLEQGAVVALMKHMTQNQAEASVTALRNAYGDWNEARVSQYQELAQHLRTSSRKKGVALLRDLTPAARSLKDYLQDVFQKTHGLELEFLRDDEQQAVKTMSELVVLGLPGAAYLLWVATGQIPIYLPLAKLFDKLGLIPKTSSIRKARTTIEPLVPKGQDLPFLLAMYEIVELLDHPVSPSFSTVPALKATPYGTKAHEDFLNAQARAAAQAERDEARRIAAEKKEAELEAKEEEKRRKKSEAEAKKRAREMERKRKASQKERDAERKKKEAEKAKIQAKKDAEKAKIQAKKDAEKAKIAAKKAAEKAKLQAKKEAERKKKAAAKKAAAKKAAAKKAAAKKAAAKKTASKKKAASKKPASKKAPAKKKPAAKKKAAKKPASKKAPARKSAAKKAPAKKAAKKAPARKSAAKKKSAKKPASKKAPARKSAAKKKPARRR